MISLMSKIIIIFILAVIVSVFNNRCHYLVSVNHCSLNMSCTCSVDIMSSLWLNFKTIKGKVQQHYISCCCTMCSDSVHDTTALTSKSAVHYLLIGEKNNQT